ncbi:MAG: methyltransferase domain-containing protein, partial [Acidimicrobiales bacterium]
MFDFLPRTVPAEPGRPELADDRRPIREVTRQIAFDPGGWSPERAVHVAAMFDGLAPSWHERPAAGRYEAVDDALARGGPFPPGPCLEIGSGTGLVTPRLAARFSPLVSMDLSPGMLALAPAGTFRLRADSSTLPVRHGAAAVVALVNMFLFPAEVDRVLAPDG